MALLLDVKAGSMTARTAPALVICVAIGMLASQLVFSDLDATTRILLGGGIGALLFGADLIVVTVVRSGPPVARLERPATSARARALSGAGIALLIAAGLAQGADVERPWPLLLLVLGAVLRIGGRAFEAAAAGRHEGGETGR